MGTLEWGKPVVGWQLSVSLDKEQIPWSEPVFVSIVLKNVGPQSQAVQSASRWAYDLQMEDEEGVVPPTRFGTGVKASQTEAPYVPAVLPPGETLVCEIPVSRVFDLSEGGVFRLQVSRRLSGSKPADEIRVTSNQVSFEITED